MVCERLQRALLGVVVGSTICAKRMERGGTVFFEPYWALIKSSVVFRTQCLLRLCPSVWTAPKRHSAAGLVEVASDEHQVAALSDPIAFVQQWPVGCDRCSGQRHARVRRDVAAVAAPSEVAGSVGAQEVREARAVARRAVWRQRLYRLDSR